MEQQKNVSPARPRPNQHLSPYRPRFRRHPRPLGRSEQSKQGQKPPSAASHAYQKQNPSQGLFEPIPGLEFLAPKRHPEPSVPTRRQEPNVSPSRPELSASKHPSQPSSPKRRPFFRLGRKNENKGIEEKLKIIVLGGLEEVGRNMTVFEYGNDIVILDMGLQFPEENMPGIDYIIPNIEYLKGKENRIRAVIFSHGHLDHIGAAPILLERLGFPAIVGRPLTLALLKHRQEDYKSRTVKNLKTIQVKSLRDTFKFGIFKISFFKIDHSVMDAMGVIIETPAATVVHTGDWTLEKNEQGRATIDYSYLSRLKRPLILMSEALGVIDVRPSATSPKMKKNIAKILTEAGGRVIIGTFASQVERIKWIIEAAEKMGKKIAVDGYSMKINIEIAKKLGYIKAHEGTLIKIDQVNNYPDNKIVVLVTGAQGESNAVFSRIITGSHRHLKIKKTDTIIFSSSIIPGNERSIQTLKDGIYRQTENVIHGEIMDIHVSGHANREDNVHLLKQIKPNYYLPVYAYHYMLVEAGKMARSIGFPEKNILILDNGQIAAFDSRGGRATNERVPSEYVFVDGLGVGDLSHVVLRERQMMSESGMVVIIAMVESKTGALVGNPDIISRGFVYMKDKKELIEQTRAMAKKVLQEKHPRSSASEAYLKNKIRDQIGEFLFKKTEKRPMVLPVIIGV